MKCDKNNEFILKVNEIFDSIDGEGKRAGKLVTFIRLTGCNLRCSYCDTAYAFAAGEDMTAAEVLSRVHYLDVTITGGEPLLQNLHPLLRKMQNRCVNIETNGSIGIRPYLDYPHVFFTMDFKCRSSGMTRDMFLPNFRELRKRDVLKFVVGSREDLEQALAFCRKQKPKCQVYASPVFGSIEPKDIVAFMKEHHLEDWKVQLQLHKFIWNPQERGV